MPPNTKERLITAAHDIFYCDGFHAVGLDRIIREVNVTKTTFYNHFESKDSLIIEVLNWHDRWWRDSFVEMLRRLGGDSPRGQLLAIPDALAEMFASGEFSGCIFINVSVEFPLVSDPAHQAAAVHKSSMEDIIRQIAGYAGADDAQALAEELSMIMEGAYVTQQVSQKNHTADIARSLCTQAIDHRVPDRSK